MWQARERKEETKAFVEKLWAADYLVPEKPGGKGFALLAAQEETLFLPAYTSEKEIARRQGPRGRRAVLRLAMLHHIVVDDPRLSGVVINPFGVSLVLRRADLLTIEQTVTGMTHARVEHRGQAFLSPARCSPALTEAFTAALENSGMNVAEGYILTARAQEETPHLLFLIDFRGDRKLLFPRIADALRPHMPPGAMFELRQASPALLGAARQVALPVYKRDTLYH
ncbi:MAG: enhanced serine sensitivity protein SseB [Gracilibacteraceae bacterium]|nr:enhanced serine sensitivity protein SseB [Gracilibacteraceae bacterium]